MEVRISELRDIWEAAFSYLEENNMSSVMLDVDYYWHIPLEECYNPYEKPQDMTLGQLSDDLINLRSMVKRDELIAYSLVWLSAVTRAVGERIVGK